MLLPHTFTHDRIVSIMLVPHALHWLDRPRFYNEVARLLKPGGIFAILTYDFGVIRMLPQEAQHGDSSSTGGRTSAVDPDPDLARIWDFGFTSKKLGPYWAAPRRLVDEQLRGV